MAGTIIQIKRTTSGNIPSSTEQGELFYVYGGNTGSLGSQSNGHRLFIGDPTTNTNTPIKIGGDYYTALMDHDHGTLTANAGIIVDSNKAIDDLYVGNNSTIGGSIKFNEGTNNGPHYVALKASDSLTSSITFRLPTAHAASNGQALVADTSGNLSFATVGGTLDIAADSGTDNGVNLGTDTLTISGGTGINTSVSGDVITVNGDIATTSAVGVASFATADFGVTVGGEVSLNDAVVKSITTDSTALPAGTVMTPSSHGFSILGGEGIDVTHTGTTISVVGEDASSSNKGVASFDGTDFVVSNGNVSLSTTPSDFSTIIVGTTKLTGSTITSTTGSNVTITTDTGNLELDPAGDVDVNGHNIVGVADPVNSTDAANKQYVDAVAEGLHIHASVEVASTTNFSGFSAGTITLSSPIAVSTGIDGFTDAAHLVTGARILIKDQTVAAENGIYTMSVSGTAGNEQIDSFTRAADFDTATEIAGGDFVFVIHGTNYANTGWVQTEHVTTVNTDDISFTQFSGAGTYLAGNGLTITGSTFAVGGSSTIIANADDIEVNSSATQYQVLVSGGTAGTAATFGALSLDQSAAVTGTLPVANGGTGATSLTANGIIYGNGTNAVSATAAGTNGYILYSNNGTPDWLSAISLTSQVSGTLPVANGGTGITTTPQGSVLISNTLDTFSALDGGSTITATNDVGVLIYSQATDTVSWSNTIDGGTYS